MTYQFDPTVQAADETMISIAVSPVQLAAILENASLTEGETRANRIWGAVGLVGGALELLGSAALLVDPDPTISKVVGVVGLVHGADTVSTSWEQLRTGSSQTTLTAQGATALAQTLGMSPEAAGITGAIVDIAVPTGVAGALGRSQKLFAITRVSKVRAGFVSLEEEEQLFQSPGKPSAAAHALRDHCGKTLSDMLARFKAKPSLEATASFRNVAEAEQAVSQVLRSNKAVIRRWASSPGGKPLRLSEKLAKDIGEGVINPAKNAVTPGAVHGSLRIKTVTVVLNKTTLHGRTWYVLTAFPDILRDLGRVPM